MPTTALEHWIITANIARFQKILETEDDPARRKIVKSLLGAERGKLGFKPGQV